MSDSMCRHCQCPQLQSSMALHWVVGLSSR